MSDPIRVLRVSPIVVVVLVFFMVSADALFSSSTVRTCVQRCYGTRGGRARGARGPLLALEAYKARAKVGGQPG